MESSQVFENAGYNFDFNTTYLEENNYEKSETLYRKQFLKVFNIEIYDFIEINKIIPIIYETIKNEVFFDELFETLKKNTKLPFEIKKEDLILLLFQYDYFHYFHQLLQLLNNKQDYQEIKNTLLNKIRFLDK
tara:strand:- start:201 stop:599 length:399 start_codon:yes stop_codon:yes gene_type:complete